MTFPKAFTICVLLLSGLRASAAESYVRVLLPVVIDGVVPGSHGSLWTTTLSVTNNGTSDAEILGYDWAPEGCGILCPTQVPTPPGVTFFPSVAHAGSSPGAVLLVESSALADVSFHLRVQDISRQSETWGTELPVVAESEFRSDVIRLSDVPLSDAFRLALRIYDLESVDDSAVLVRIFAINPELKTPIPFDGPSPPPDALLLERIVPLAVQSNSGDARYDFGYAQAGDFGHAPELAGAGRVRLEITPRTAGMSVWAFVSVTNDATQHVTTVTP